MYNLIEYSSNYSNTTGSLQFCPKDEETNFNADIADINNIKSVRYKDKSLENTVSDGNNLISRNASITLPLKYLSNFWRSFEMQVINCKVKLKFKWAKYCALGVDNVNADSNNIIFTIKNANLYFPAVTLSAKDNQKLSKLLSKGFERSSYWNEYKTKSENKNTANEYRYFLELTDCLY